MPAQRQLDTFDSADFLQRVQVMAQARIGHDAFGHLVRRDFRQHVVGREQHVAQRDADLARAMARRMNEPQAVELLAVDQRAGSTGRLWTFFFEKPYTSMKPGSRSLADAGFLQEAADRLFGHRHALLEGW